MDIKDATLMMMSESAYLHPAVASIARNAHERLVNGVRRLPAA